MELFAGRSHPAPAAVSAELRALAGALSPRLRLGTSSWSFPGWAGTVWAHPLGAELLAREGLPAYAAHPMLRIVSVDRSYYGPVAAATWARYAQQAPAGFRFSVKAPQRLTSPLAPDGSPNADFLSAGLAEDVLGPILEHLGDRLDAWHLQVPPGPAPPNGLTRLAELLGALPTTARLAVEPRDRSWLGPAYREVLAAAGAVHVLSVHPAMPELREQWVEAGVATGGRLHVRWNLAPGLTYRDAKARWAPFSEMARPDLATRDRLAKACRWALARDWDVTVIANNKAEGCAPATLMALAEAIAEGP